MPQSLTIRLDLPGRRAPGPEIVVESDRARGHGNRKLVVTSSEFWFLVALGSVAMICWLLPSIMLSSERVAGWFMDHLPGLFDAMEALFVGAFAFTGLVLFFVWLFER